MRRKERATRLVQSRMLSRASQIWAHRGQAAGPVRQSAKLSELRHGACCSLCCRTAWTQRGEQARVQQARVALHSPGRAWDRLFMHV